MKTREKEYSNRVSKPTGQRSSVNKIWIGLSSRHLFIEFITEKVKKKVKDIKKNNLHPKYVKMISKKKNTTFLKRRKYFKKWI